ncbi:hypothetical protein VPH35_071399 [Triticum aestivum]
MQLERFRAELEQFTSVHAMQDYLWGLDEKTRVQILTFWWHWWNNRNKVREGELPVEVAELTRRAMSNTLEYMQLFTPKTKPVPDCKWQPPPHDRVKINLDGAFTPGENFVSWGVVIRDHTGEVLLARDGRTDNTADPFAAEMIAMSQAISMAVDVGAHRAIFETDSKLLQEALDFTKADASSHAAIIEDIKFQLKMWFSNQSINACRRSANTVAHELAKLGRSCSFNNCIEWDSHVPPVVAVCVMGDLPVHC